MKKLILLLIFMQLGAAVSKAQDLYKNMNAPIHERVQDLLDRKSVV